MKLKGVLLVLLSLLASGCAGSLGNIPPNVWLPPTSSLKSSAPPSVQITYLGAGGYLMRNDNTSLLTAPFFSNPGFLNLIFGKIRPDSAQIDRFLSPLKPELTKIQTILLGHSHYDHLMDIPYIISRYTPNASIYGNQTMRHILAPAVPREQSIAVNNHAAGPGRTGQWIVPKDEDLRFLPIISEHAPHFLGIKLFSGFYDNDLNELPVRASQWKEGETLAYLIDFMEPERKTVSFRIYYQDAASTPPKGLPPDFTEAADQKRIDAAILCVAGFNQVKNYPEGAIKGLKPRYVILGHWENFFKPIPEDISKLGVVPGTNLQAFIRRLKKCLPDDTRFILPRPGDTITVPMERRGSHLKY